MKLVWNPFTTNLDYTGTGGGGGGISTINNISPTGGGNFTITAGTGVTITPGTNAITLSINGAGFTWSDKAITFSAVAENGYFCTAALTANLPASPSQGDTIIINCVTASSVVIQANTGQTIVIGSSSSTVAGTATSSVSGNSLTLVYRSTGSTWRTISGPQGTWTTA